MLLAAILVAQAVSPSPAPYATWNAITLGAPASTLRPGVGDPLRITLFDNGASRFARYWLPGSDSTYLIVIEVRGYIKVIDIFTDAAPTAVFENVPPDQLGVRLGDTFEAAQQQAAQLHRDTDEGGAPILIGRLTPAIGAAYSFQGNRVQSIHWTTALPAAAPDLPPLTLAAGDAISSAIFVVQKNEMDGVAWEYRFLSFHPCADGAFWKLKSQSLLHDGGRAYDRLHVFCPPTKAERDFYFDITSYFGKL